MTLTTPEGKGAVDAIKIAPDGSILARMNDRWHIVSGVEGRD